MGSDGDILLRDRKMYVAPTPFALLEGVERQITLILPASWPQPNAATAIGQFTRTEAKQLMTGYQFNLKTNELTATDTKNPSAGTQHKFVAYRPSGSPSPLVRMWENKP